MQPVCEPGDAEDHRCRGLFRLCLLAYAGPPSHPSAEPFWRPVARACAQATDEHGGFWPVWAKCTVLNIWGEAIPEGRVDRCINQVQRERERIRACNNCGDPVRDVISCLGLH